MADPADARHLEDTSPPVCSDQPDDAGRPVDVPSAADLAPAFVDLPAEVRQRVLHWVSDALHAVEPAQLPASLRRIASFAPRPRRRAAAVHVAKALRQERFRVRMAEAVAERQPALAQEAAAESPDPAVDPLDRAAAWWLWRPDGWAERLSAVLAVASQEPEVLAADVEPSGQSARQVLQAEVDDARAQLREERDRQRDRVVRLRDERDRLRAGLTVERARADDLDDRLLTAHTEHTQALAHKQAAEAEARAEVRRLRRRVEQLEALRGEDSRARREERSLATARLRLLLDTVVDGASGLRRELALPPVTAADLAASPAETVDARPPGAEMPPPRAHQGAGDRHLEELLGLPRAHLVVDGYNVTKADWGSLSLAEQRLRLLRELGPVAARHGAEVTVVFDGADLARPPAVPAARGVRVRFSPQDQSADDVIRALVRAEPPGRVVVVVSTDREVAESVARSGAHAVPSAALLALLSRP